MAKGSKLVYTTDPAEAKKLREEGAMPEVRDLPAPEQKIRVALDRRPGKDKTVTIASGFRLTPDSLEKVARQLKARCAAGGTTKGDTIEVQGDHVGVVANLLAGLGYHVRKG
jgi:translation initiation factor 1